MRSEAKQREYNLRRRCQRKIEKLLSSPAMTPSKLIAILAESLFEGAQQAMRMGASFEIVTDHITKELKRLDAKVCSRPNSPYVADELPELPPQLPISHADRVMGPKRFSFE